MSREQDAIIAEWRGWKQCRPGIDVWTAPGDDWTGLALPLFSSDLNAMAEALDILEKIGPDVRQKYEDELSKCVPGGPGTSTWHMINATAPQQAEALIRVIQEAQTA